MEKKKKIKFNSKLTRKERTEMFDVYKETGKLSDVQKRCNKTYPTVSKYYKSDRWEDMILDEIKRTSREISFKRIETLNTEIDMVREVTKKVVSHILGNDDAKYSTKDLDTVVRLGLLLSGINPENYDLSGKIKDPKVGVVINNNPNEKAGKGLGLSDNEHSQVLEIFAHARKRKDDISQEPLSV